MQISFHVGGMAAALGRIGRILSLVGLILAFCAATAAAQPAPGVPPAPQATAAPVSADELQRLVATIENEGKRNELLAALRGLIAAQRATAGEAEAKTISGRLIALLNTSYDATRQTLDTVGDALGGWPDWMAQARHAVADPAKRQRGVDAVLAFVAIFAIGWVAELLVWWLLTVPRRHLDTALPASVWERLWRGTLRVLLDLVPVAIFAAAAYVAALTMEPPRSVQTMALNFVNAYVLARALLAFGRMLLSPRAPALRPLPLTDAAARDLFHWVRRFVATGVGGFFLIAAAVLLGLPRRLTPALYDALYLILATLAVVFIVRHRRQVAAWLEGKADRCERFFAVAPLLRALAAVWHVLAIGYLAALLVIGAFNIENGIRYVLHGTLVTAAAVAVVAIAISLLRPDPATMTRAAAASAATATLNQRLVSYVPFVRLGIAVVIVFGAIAFVLEAWGIAAVDWLAASRGQRFLGGGLSIALTLVFAVIAWEIANAAIERYLTQRNATGQDVRLPSARARTLLPLARKVLVVLLTVMVALITLSELGIDIAPLLAGAGVVGLAIGFGAQKLVQDVITGFFILVEDAIAVGDVVTVAGASGVVEDLSVRVIKLRDVSGNVHTVPFSSVDTVTNMTKTFSYYLADVAVSYKANTDEVGRICREIVEEMRGEITYAVSILKPLELLGLERFADSAVIVRARIMTRPGKQWDVGREFNRRLKMRFDALGIEFPFPQHTIFFGSDGETAEAALPAAATDASAPSAPSPLGRS